MKLPCERENLTGIVFKQIKQCALSTTHIVDMALCDLMSQSAQEEHRDCARKKTGTAPEKYRHDIAWRRR